MHQLTAADLRHSRLHLFWVQALLSVIVVVMLIREITRPVTASSELAERAPLGSFDYVSSGFQITVLVLLVTVWIAPRMTLMWMVPVAWLVPLTGLEAPMMWRVLAVACLAVLVWMLIRSHRAQPDGRRHRLAVEGEFKDSLASRPAGWGWAVVAGGIAVTIALLFTHQWAMTQTQEFEERATLELAEVIAYDDDALEMSVRIGSEELTLGEPLWDERPDVGAVVPVLIDPEDPTHVVFADSLEDPSWLLGLALAAPLPGLGWGLPIIVRAQRRRRLANVGGRATLVVLAHSMEHDYEILPVDGGAPLLRVVTMQGLVPADDALLHGPDRDDEDAEDDDHCGFDESDDEEFVADDPLPETDWELAAWADESKREMDEEFGWSDLSHLDDEDKTLLEAEFGPEIEGHELFTMLGSWSHGSTVALVRDSGQVWMAQIREPRLRASGRGWGFGTSGRPGPHKPRWGGIWVGRMGDSLAAWSERNFQWFRWVAALAVAATGALWVGVVVRSGLETGWGGFDWVKSVVLIVGLLPWPLIVAGNLPSPGVARSRSGVVFYGFVTDDMIAPDRLVSVASGNEAVALRLQDPDDAIMVLPEQIGRDLDTHQSAHEIRSWLLAAPGRARSGPRPSAGLVGVVVMVAAWTVQIIVLLL